MQADSFVLLNVDNREVLGIAPALAYSSFPGVVVTVQSQGVYIYDVSDQKCKSSYLLAPGSTFSHHAVHHPSTKKFLAVQQNKYLCAWPEDAKDLKKVARKSYDQGDIAFLTVDKFLANRHLMVFQDGTIAIGTPDLQIDTTLSTAGLTEKCTVSWVNIKREGQILFIFLVLKTASNKYLFSVFSVTRSKDEFEPYHCSVHKLGLEAPNQKATMTTCAFDLDSFTLTALWSNGTLQFYKFDSAEDLAGRNDSLRLFLTRKLSIFHGTKGVVAINVRPSVTLIAGPTPKSTTQLLTMWDTNYGVIQGTKEISHEASDLAKTAGGILASAPLEQATLRQVVLSSDQNLMVFNLGQSVVINPVWVLATSLASALGNLTATHKYLAPEKNVETNQQFNLYAHIADPSKKQSVAVIINDENAMDVDMDAHREAAKQRAKISEDVLEGIVVSENTDEIWKRLVAPSQKKELDTIDTLTNKSKTPSLESFMAVFRPYLKDAKVASQNVLRQHIKDGVVSEESKAWKNLHQYSRSVHEKQQNKVKAEELRKSALGLSQDFIRRVALRCLEEEFLWEPLGKLIETKALSTRSLPQLIPTLIEKKQLELLIPVLLYVSDISEAEIITILKHLIQVADQDMEPLENSLNSYLLKKNGSKKGIRNQPADFVLSALERYIAAIVNTPFNPIFMTQVSRLLSAKELIVLLRFLLRWIQWYNVEGYVRKATIKTSVAIPTPDTIVEWVSLLLDAHMAPLILVEECQQLAADLREAVEERIQLSEQMQRLQGVLVSYMSHDPHQEDQIAEYAVETINL